MSESTPVAATVQQIKAAFPKAKAEFVLSCIEKSLPLASVAAAAAEEMMKENEELVARCTAMEEELTALRAKAMEDEDPEKKPEASEDSDDDDKEEPMAPAAKFRGVKPVAWATSGKPVASVRWKSLIEEKMATGIPRAQAIVKVDAENPGLRAQYLAEVNAAR